MDAAQLAAPNRQVTPLGRAACQHQRVEVGLQIRYRDVDADLDTGAEPRAFGAHLVEPPLDVALFHFELGDAVAQQPAEAVCTLEHRHVVAGSV